MKPQRAALHLLLSYCVVRAILDNATLEKAIEQIKLNLLSLELMESTINKLYIKNFISNSPLIFN